MFAIEKVRGIAGIKGERFEAFEGSKGAGSPLPTIAELAYDTKAAFIFRESVDVGGIPTGEIEIAATRQGRFITPRKFAIDILRRAIGGALPLRFCGEGLFSPASEGTSFGVTDVHGPSERQREILEHAAVEPFTDVFFPEGRIMNGILLFPLPIRRRPETRILVATVEEEVEEVAVGDDELVDAEGGNFDVERFVFVIPAKAGGIFSGKAKARRAGGNF